MMKPKLVIAMGYIDEDLISRAIEYKPRMNNQKKMYLAKIAACVTVVCMAFLPVVFGFVGGNATDIYRRGEKIIISDIKSWFIEYENVVLVENLDFEIFDEEKIELFYDKNGMAENVNDWYSILIRGKYLEKDITIYCLYDETKNVEDWKVSMVFQTGVTEMIEVNGTTVEVSGRDVPLEGQKQYYAIFEYQDVVYDIRIVSDTIDDMYAVLTDMLQEE